MSRAFEFEFLKVPRIPRRGNNDESVIAIVVYDNCIVYSYQTLRSLTRFLAPGDGHCLAALAVLVAGC